ncbi:MAG: PAS domain-containing protein [Alphaproteobacteria bacterium]
MSALSTINRETRSNGVAAVHRYRDRQGDDTARQIRRNRAQWVSRPGDIENIPKRDGVDHGLARALAAGVNYAKRQGLDYAALTKPQLIERLQERDLCLDELNDAGLPHGTELESLKQAEHLLTKITDALPVLISYVDSDLCYRVCNQAYETWFGITRASIIGRHVKNVVGNAAYDVIRGYVERALTGETVVYEDTIHYAYGPIRNTHAHYEPDFDDSGKVKGIFVSITDITELKNSENALQALRGELETRVWQRTAEFQNANDALEQKALE